MVDQPRTRDEVDAALHHYFVSWVQAKYEIQPDLTVSVFGRIRQNTRAYRIPLKFNAVPGFIFESLLSGLKDLSCLPEEIFDEVRLTYYKDLPLLRCLNARLIMLGNPKPEMQQRLLLARGIMGKYQGQGRPAAVACAAELAAAGLKENARW